jgi:hypothetical protein
MTTVNRLKRALTYAKNLNDNLEQHPIPELPPDNVWAAYAKSLELQKIAIKTRYQTNAEFMKKPDPPTNINPNDTTPKIRFVK